MADTNRDLADALDTLRAIARGPQRRPRNAREVGLALDEAVGLAQATVNKIDARNFDESEPSA